MREATARCFIQRDYKLWTNTDVRFAPISKQCFLDSICGELMPRCVSEERGIRNSDTLSVTFSGNCEASFRSTKWTYLSIAWLASTKQRNPAAVLDYFATIRMQFPVFRHEVKCKKCGAEINANRTRGQSREKIARKRENSSGNRSVATNLPLTANTNPQKKKKEKKISKSERYCYRANQTVRRDGVSMFPV